jgi:DNA-binding CsgD family transcriptional regulator
MAGILFDLALWNAEHPDWVIYFNYPILSVSLICLVLSATGKIPFRTSFLIYIYLFSCCFYLPGFIDPSLSKTDTLSYFSKIGACIAYLFFAGLIGAGKHVLSLGAINLLLYLSLSYFFYTKQDLFYIDYVNMFSIIAIPVIVYIMFQHIDKSIGENEENKLRLKNAETELLHLRIEEENKRNHYLSVIQQSNSDFVANFDSEIDSILKEMNDDSKAIKIKELKRLCNAFRYSTEKTDNAQWQKHTDAEFIAALQKYCPELSAKEQYICSLIRIRLSTKQIADNLNVSVETIKWHRKNIRKKLQMESNMDFCSFFDLNITSVS